MGKIINIHSRAADIFRSKIPGTILVPAWLMPKRASDVSVVKEAHQKGYIKKLDLKALPKSLRVINELAQRQLADPNNIFMIPMRIEKKITVHNRSVSVSSFPAYVFKGVGSAEVKYSANNKCDWLKSRFYLFEDFYGHNQPALRGGLLAYEINPSLTRRLHDKFNDVLKNNYELSVIARLFLIGEDVFYTPECEFLPLMIPFELNKSLRFLQAYMIDLKLGHNAILLPQELLKHFGMDSSPTKKQRIVLYKTASNYRFAEYSFCDGTYPDVEESRFLIKYYGLCNNANSLQFMISAFHARVSLVHHILDNLHLKGGDINGRIYTPHNMNYLSVFDYDTIQKKSILDHMFPNAFENELPLISNINHYYRLPRYNDKGSATHMIDLTRGLLSRFECLRKRSMHILFNTASRYYDDFGWGIYNPPNILPYAGVR